MNFQSVYDVIVIGGGHAGTEAALAASRMGCVTLLITHNIETLGQMSCNPAIGGIGKSHLVREIDAMGGAMALAADQAGIQFRILNSRKGSAVRATRAQADRLLYKAAIRHVLENQENLSIFQQAVDDLIIENSCVCGVITQTGLRFKSRTVILTAGTFLAGMLHVGLSHHPGGRAGEQASTALAQQLRALGLRTGRLKTGTPPRIDRRTIDFSLLKPQPGDTPVPVMSFMGSAALHPAQVPCHITATNAQTHDIIRQNLDRSPMYTGVIEGIGPRYCPSIEDKIHRFADKSSHQIFLEPEGLTSQEIYPNGISTSLPFDVQVQLVHSIKGMERAHIIRPGYAIEYDFFDPRDLFPTLESRAIVGLFMAGQINGTTGYEEAAAQGLLAGINAALKSREKAPWVPTRDLAYLAVMVDDLITAGTREPYRMFTSRAEFRLQLREDNADLRLTPVAMQLGLVDLPRIQAYEGRREAIACGESWLTSTVIQPDSVEGQRLQAVTGEVFSREYTLKELLRRPQISINDLVVDPSELHLTDDVAEQLEINTKYAGYIARQSDEVARMQRYEHLKLPADFDFTVVHGLSKEVLSKLLDVRPLTLAQASRIPGVTPAAVSLLLIHLKRWMDLPKAG